jgi:ribonuclease P protein component
MKLPEIKTMKKRADFLMASRLGVPVRTRSVVVLFVGAESVEKKRTGMRKVETQTVETYVGYTASKKCGCAVLRNRAKRRLRALVREFKNEISSLQGTLVFIATKSTPVAAPSALRSDFDYAIRKLCKKRHIESSINWLGHQGLEPGK